MKREATALLERLDHADIPPARQVGALRPPPSRSSRSPARCRSDMRLLIMDEPSAILDDDEVETLFGVVRRLTAEGVGVVYISHRLDEIPRIGDRVTVLSDGRTVATGLPADTPAGELVEHMVGPQGRAALPRPPGRRPTRSLLDVRDVARRPEVRGVSLQVRAGEVARHRRAGRRRAHASCCGLIYGLDVARRGRGARGRQAAAARASPRAAIAAGLGLAPEDRKSQGLLLDWSLAKNVEPRRPRPLHARRAARPSAPSARRSASSCARSTPSPTTPTASSRELSGGNQQKVVLARWLLRECRVLLLDEPTRGVDVGAKAEIYRVICRPRRRRPRRARRLLRAPGAGRHLHPHPRHARGRDRRRGRRRRRDRARAAAPRRRPDRHAPVLAEEIA